MRRINPWHSLKTGDAWVGFRNNTGLAWLRFLKPGFRHCFVVLRQGGVWVVYDPLAHHTRIDVVAGDEAFLDHLCEQGCRLIPVRLAEPPLRPAPWRPYSCVEAVKRVLGLKARPEAVNPCLKARRSRACQISA